MFRTSVLVSTPMIKFDTQRLSSHLSACCWCTCAHLWQHPQDHRSPPGLRQKEALRHSAHGTEGTPREHSARTYNMYIYMNVSGTRHTFFLQSHKNAPALRLAGMLRRVGVQWGKDAVPSIARHLPLGTCLRPVPPHLPASARARVVLCFAGRHRCCQARRCRRRGGSSCDCCRSLWRPRCEAYCSAETADPMAAKCGVS